MLLFWALLSKKSVPRSDVLLLLYCCTPLVVL
jgi:hypothetical protein